MEQEKQRTIFIIDDDNFLLDMYALRFSQAGFTVKTGENADQALEALRGGLTPDCLLLDVVMPIMDGFELLETIRSESLIPSTVKVILSNLGQEHDVVRGKELGAASYIVKANSTPSEVVAHVNNLLQEKTTV